MKTTKSIKLAAMLAVVSACLLALVTRAQERPKVEIIGFSTPLSERLGADDGAALVVHFSGDTHGSLEPCG